jgi:hypothetical protein
MPRPPCLADSYLLEWQGWMTLSKCGACLHKPSAEEDAAWAEMYGDICAICGVGRRFTQRLRNRCDFRRCNACVVFREKNHRDKTGNEVHNGTPTLQKEWLVEGNADVCQLCGKEREGAGKFYGLRENTKCRTCYAWVNYHAKLLGQASKLGGKGE